MDDFYEEIFLDEKLSAILFTQGKLTELRQFIFSLPLFEIETTVIEMNREIVISFQDIFVLWYFFLNFWYLQYYSYGTQKKIIRKNFYIKLK